MDRTAQCTCGALSVNVIDEPFYVGICSCLNCQRAGHIFNCLAYYSSENVSEVKGEYKTYTRDCSSGNKGHSHFCCKCGTTVFAEADVMPGATAILVGCFGDPNFPAPTGATWSKRKHSWVQFPDGILEMDEQPENA